MAGKVHIKANGIAWQVLLDGHPVANFDLVGEALDFAAMIESNPRERSALKV
ncbi:MAG: hypothetical protein M3391_06275 [Actinomycetota bacterium]|nr:hypothetical protein [Actinomycetota bacterium]